MKTNGELTVRAIELLKAPPVYLAAIPGLWLIQHTTPSWRIHDPQTGFQRLVKKERAKEIARTVLDENRPFPNAITLATDKKEIKHTEHSITFPAKTKLLVVDGQHRLWAQTFSKVEGMYACILHLGKSEKQMAELFLEINDNQRRVPSSLRWDLVRLVRPAGDELKVMASELVYELATRKESPFYIALDLTGEKKDVSIKQGSLAPEINTLLSRSRKQANLSFEDYLDLLIRFFTALRSIDPDGWGDATSTFYKARVLRALLRVLTDILLDKAKHVDELTTETLRGYLSKIDKATLSEERVKLAQGAAGVNQLYDVMKKQVFPL
jgi:DGQHR domain-containing protein